MSARRKTMEMLRGLMVSVGLLTMIAVGLVVRQKIATPEVPVTTIVATDVHELLNVFAKQTDERQKPIVSSPVTKRAPVQKAVVKKTKTPAKLEIASPATFEAEALEGNSRRPIKHTENGVVVGTK